MAWYRQDQTSQCLATIPGIGPIGGVSFALKVPDPKGFRSGRQLFWIRLHQTFGTLVFAAVAGVVWGTVWAYTIATILPIATALVHRLVAVRKWMTLTTSRAALRDVPSG